MENMWTFIRHCLFLLQGIQQLSASKESCDVQCSNVYDPVCAEATTLNGNRFIKTFHNICYLHMIQCEFEAADAKQVPDELCHIKKPSTSSGRRLHDFGIVGAHQACNHTCPTYCLDIYEPACAQIWTRDMRHYDYRPMINHCHIDLYSCVAGVNVTIQPLIGKCYKNPSALNFMFNMASLKTLKLLDDSHSKPHRRNNNGNNLNYIVKKEIRDFMKKLGHRIKNIY